MQKYIVFIIVLLSLTSCSFYHTANDVPAIPLLNPIELGRHVQFSQILALHLDRRGEVDKNSAAKQELPLLLVAWSVTDSRLDIVGLTPAGQTLIKLSYDGESFVNSLFLIEDLPVQGRDIMAQLQLAYWPASAFDDRFKGTAWQLVTNGQNKQLYYKNVLIINIQMVPKSDEFDKERITITHHLMSYSVDVTTLSQVSLP